MHKLAITDANIFIDLIETEMIDFLFQLELEVHTTTEVYHQISPEQQEIIKEYSERRLLTIYSFTTQELQEIQLIEFPSGLELADRTVYYYASKLNGIILSGDRKLKSFCERNHNQVKGIIWIFDQVYERGLLAPGQLAQKMQRLIKANSRLPTEECNLRINRWKV